MFSGTGIMNSDVRLVNFNGEMVPETEAKVSIYDSALMFGYGI